MALGESRVVDLPVLGGWGVAEVRVKPTRVVPTGPTGGRELLAEPADRLLLRTIERVADGSDRGVAGLPVWCWCYRVRVWVPVVGLWVRVMVVSGVVVVVSGFWGLMSMFMVVGVPQLMLRVLE